MAKYLFVYHGGKKPDSDDEYKQVMDDWGAWFAGMGAAVVDGGNPASGYSLIEADSDDDAIAKAKGCPILKSGGSVELAEAFDM